jgi:hypothetical protein
MNREDLERIFLKSLETSLDPDEQILLTNELEKDPVVANDFEKYKMIREQLKSREPSTFGPYFTSKLIYRIEKTGVITDREIFSFFKKFQLAAIGVIIALLAVNIFIGQADLLSAFGLDGNITTEAEIPAFDYSEILNESL